MARARRQRRTLTLPWERRGAWARELLAGRRWKMLALAVAVGGLLLLVARSAEHRNRLRETRAALSETKRAIAAFEADHGRCPHALNELLHPPRGGRRYLRRVPLDGWGHTLWVRCPGRYDPGAADVVSAGPSGSFLTDDNVE